MPRPPRADEGGLDHALKRGNLRPEIPAFVAEIKQIFER